jgi:hypothetical protein
MKLNWLYKGDIYKFKGFPNIDLFIMAEGRLEVKWYNIMDREGIEDSCVSETLFVTDYLDKQRINFLYTDQSIVNGQGVCLSERALVITIDQRLY